MKKTFFVDNQFMSSRLDRWFRRNICEVPQSLIEKNIRKGNIKVNKKREKSSYKLREGDEISLYSISFLKGKNKEKVIKYLPTKKDLSISNEFFIENNENFVVLNKPSGIAVQSGTKSKKNILDILSNTKEFFNCKPYAVHRIDKETTGVLIVAKNRKWAQFFTSLFRIRKINKIYLCVISGVLEKNNGTLIDDLYTFEGEKKIKSKAITHYTVIDSNNNHSLLKLNPETGRKHQLRKQLFVRGYPILGDSKYRMVKKNNNRKKTFMLHAYKINFSIDGVKHNYIADLPLDFKNVLKKKYLKIF